jgi:hypothetical protein
MSAVEGEADAICSDGVLRVCPLADLDAAGMIEIL